MRDTQIYKHVDGNTVHVENSSTRNLEDFQRVYDQLEYLKRRIEYLERDNSRLKNDIQLIVSSIKK